MSFSPLELNLIKTVIMILFFVLLRMLLIHLTRSFARKIERVEQRTGLIVKHINFAAFFCIALGIFIIWVIYLYFNPSIKMFCR